MESQAGIAVRRWCAPLLGLEPGLPAEDYLAARLARTNEEVATALLPAAGFGRLIVETGFRGGELTSPEELGALCAPSGVVPSDSAAVPTSVVVRLETIAESVALEMASGGSAAALPDAFRDALAQAIAEGAVGTKSVVAYRVGLDLDPARPSPAEVVEAAGRWLRAIESDRRALRLDDPVLLRFLLWEGAATGLPLQVHTGYGDPDLDLRRSDPLAFTPFIRATEGLCPILLLHTYPFQRNAGYLAEMFPHVYMDVGLAVSHAGPQGAAIIAESLELTPLRKVLFSSDGWGLPELHFLGSWLFRRGIARVLGRWVEDGDWTAADARHALDLIAFENAARLYGLE
jgi:uncharacterized protein